MFVAFLACRTPSPSPNPAPRAPTSQPSPPSTPPPADCTQPDDANPVELCGERAPAYEGPCCEETWLRLANGSVQDGVCAVDEPLDHLCARRFGTCDGCPTFDEVLDLNGWRDLVPDYPYVYELSAWRCLAEETTGADYDVIAFDLVGPWCSGSTSRWWFAADGPLASYEWSWWNDSDSQGLCCDGEATDWAHPARWGPALSACEEVVAYTEADLADPGATP